MAPGPEQFLGCLVRAGLDIVVLVVGIEDHNPCSIPIGHIGLDGEIGARSMTFFSSDLQKSPTVHSIRLRPPSCPSYRHPACLRRPSCRRLACRRRPSCRHPPFRRHHPARSHSTASFTASALMPPAPIMPPPLMPPAPSCRRLSCRQRPSCRRLSCRQRHHAAASGHLGTSFFSLGTRLAIWTFSQRPAFMKGRGSTRPSGRTVFASARPLLGQVVQHLVILNFGYVFPFGPGAVALQGLPLEIEPLVVGVSNGRVLSA